MIIVNAINVIYIVIKIGYFARSILTFSTEKEQQIQNYNELNVFVILIKTKLVNSSI